MKNIKRDSIEKVINNLKPTDLIKLHNMWFEDPNAEKDCYGGVIHTMEEFNTNYETLTPLEIAMCICNGDFDPTDLYYYDCDIEGAISFNTCAFGVEPFERDETYIDWIIENKIKKTGIPDLDKVLSMPDLDLFKIETQILNRLDSVTASLFESISKKYGIPTDDKTDDYTNILDNLTDCKTELANAILNLITRHFQ